MADGRKRRCCPDKGVIIGCAYLPVKRTQPSSRDSCPVSPRSYCHPREVELAANSTLIRSSHCWHATAELTATRTATGLVQARTQWARRFLRSAENPLNKRNIRTHQYGLERAQANS